MIEPFYLRRFRVAQRKEFLMSIKGVVEVVSVCDEDDTVCAALIEHKPTYFANGGPRNEENTPEKIVCEELGIEMLWDIGSKWRFPSWKIYFLK